MKSYLILVLVLMSFAKLGATESCPDLNGKYWNSDRFDYFDAYAQITMKEKSNQTYSFKLEKLGSIEDTKIKVTGQWEESDQIGKYAAWCRQDRLIVQYYKNEELIVFFIKKDGENEIMVGQYLKKNERAISRGQKTYDFVEFFDRW